MVHLSHAWHQVRVSLGGVLLCAMMALSAMFVSEHHGGPQLLYALMFGLSLHFLSSHPDLKPGIDFCGRHVLRVGVALLGARIGFGQIQTLGLPVAAMTVAGVVLTIGLGALLARVWGRSREAGLISGCSVGICGASAALAVASVLPATKENERFTLLAVVGVTLLSTVAMMVYPLLTPLVGFSSAQAGIFFGATIHDVAQVVAAGTMLSSPGDTTPADNATVVKLMRVMMLLPTVLVISIGFRKGSSDQSLALDGSTPTDQVPLVPGFLLAFIVLMLLNTGGQIPKRLIDVASECSKAFLVIAIAAAGIKTSFADLGKLGWWPVLLLVSETVFLACFVGMVLWVI